MHVLSLGVCLIACASCSAQTTLHVNADCGDDAWSGLNDICEAPDGPKATIQAAIDAGVAGDTVLVAPGLYTGPGNKNLDFDGKAMILRSIDGAASCVIDCQGDGRGFFFQADLDAAIVIDGFTVTRGGVDNSYAGGRKGGAVYVFRSSPTLLNCVFDDNRGHTGGAVFCGDDSVVTLVNCRLTNHVGIDGRDEDDIHIGAGLFARNRAEVTMINCTIADNVCARPGPDHIGGGILIRADSSALIVNSVLWGNSAVSGDQIAVTDGATLTVEHCIVEGGIGEVFVDGGTLDWRTGNLDADPLFVDTASLDYSLGDSSPGIDAGRNEALPPDSTDVDGDGDVDELFPRDLVRTARFTDDPQAPDTGDGGQSGLPIVDMGALERAPCLADFNGDGAVDTLDVLAFLNAWNAREPEADINGDGSIDTLDVLEFLNAWAAGC